MEVRKEIPLIPMIVRQQLFDNPNAVLVDLIGLIKLNREIIEKFCTQFAREEKPFCALVLLGRGDLCVTQASSPVTLPEWFPILGGRSIATIIEDVTWTGEAPLNAEECRVPNICEALFELEKALIPRIDHIHNNNHSAVNAFLDLVRKNVRPQEDMKDVLAKATEALSEVRNPSAYRPSVRDGRSLIARLWRLTNERSPDQLVAASKALASALGVAESWNSKSHESLLSVIGTPPGRQSPSTRFARNILETVAGASRFVTAAAHSDAYCSYPVALLLSMSFDLRKALMSLTDELSSLEPLNGVPE
jgi:hypothetical protein